MANPQHIHRGTPRPVAHRAATSTWAIDRAWLRIDDVRHASADRVRAARQRAGQWLDHPIEATRSFHAAVGLGYTAFAMFAGLAVVLMGAHR